MFFFLSFFPCIQHTYIRKIVQEFEIQKISSKRRVNGYTKKKKNEEEINLKK